MLFSVNCTAAVPFRGSSANGAAGGQIYSIDISMDRLSRQHFIGLEDVVIRPLQDLDLPELLRIEAACYSRPWSAAQFRQELRNPAAHVEGCFFHESLCGYHCYWLIAGEMQILNLAVAPEYRGRRVAVRLLDHAISTGCVQGLQSAWLEVRRGNQAAITLYRRQGFRVQGERSGYYHDGEDALVMSRYFSSSPA